MNFHVVFGQQILIAFFLLSFLVLELKSIMGRLHRQGNKASRLPEVRCHRYANSPIVGSHLRYIG